LTEDYQTGISQSGPPEVIVAMGTFFGGVAMSFGYKWQIALAMLAVMPVVATAGGMVAKVAQQDATVKAEMYGAAGAVATEALQNARTIASFNMQVCICGGRMVGGWTHTLLYCMYLVYSMNGWTHTLYCMYTRLWWTGGHTPCILYYDDSFLFGHSGTCLLRTEYMRLLYSDTLEHFLASLHIRNAHNTPGRSGKTV
jgi:hypothetical protein